MSLKTLEKSLCLIPCFNEAANLPGLLGDLQHPELIGRCDLLFLDDASTDATPEILRNSGHATLRQKTNAGYGAAVKAGLRHARERGYARMVVFPGDRQRSVADLLLMLNEMESGTWDLVVGSKLRNHQSIPWPRALGNRFFSALSAAIWRAPFTDVLSGFKVYRVASVFPLLELLPDRYEFDLVLSAYCGRLGLAVREVPVSVHYHAHSTKMKSTMWIGMRMLGAAVRHLFLRGGKPVAWPVEE
ncbi:MAG: glycosyltransferase family 2 protein [bacterium]